MITVVLTLLFSLVVPLPLLIIEKFLPYPFMIEEGLKVILVLLLLSQEKILKKSLAGYVILAALLFSLSESIFYLINILTDQRPDLFFKRLLFTTTLHVGTVLIIYLLAKKKRALWILGLIITMAIHYLYNFLLLTH